MQPKPGTSLNTARYIAVGSTWSRLFAGAAMNENSTERVFVLVIESVPILAFRARSLGEAMELGREAWLLEDLRHLTSDRVPLWDGKAPIRIRSARPAEGQRYREGLHDASCDDDELPLVYLIGLDDHVKVAEPVGHGAFPPQR
jgi:hypothetical protein